MRLTVPSDSGSGDGPPLLGGPGHCPVDLEEKKGGLGYAGSGLNTGE